MSIIKNQEDLKNLKYSARILASCLKHVEKMVKPGVSCGDLDEFAIDFIRSYGAEPSFLGLYGYPHALISEIDDEVVHGLSGKDKIIPEKGVVSFDSGVVYEGMYSDMCTLLSVGEISEDENFLMEKTKESLWAGINVVKAGKRVGDIGHAVDSVLQKAKLGNVLDLGGHGLGYAPHDDPHITHAGKPGKGARLFENQVIAIEPMVTLGSGEVDFVKDEATNWDIVYSKERVPAAHVEHTILVTKKGHEVLTLIKEEDILPIK